MFPANHYEPMAPATQFAGAPNIPAQFHQTKTPHNHAPTMADY